VKSNLIEEKKYNNIKSKGKKIKLHKNLYWFTTTLSYSSLNNSTLEFFVPLTYSKFITIINYESFKEKIYNSHPY